MVQETQRWERRRLTPYDRWMESRNLPTQRATNGRLGADKARDQILARHYPDQISFLIDNRGQTQSRRS